MPHVYPICGMGRQLFAPGRREKLEERPYQRCKYSHSYPLHFFFSFAFASCFSMRALRFLTKFFVEVATAAYQHIRHSRDNRHIRGWKFFSPDVVSRSTPYAPRK